MRHLILTKDRQALCFAYIFFKEITYVTVDNLPAASHLFLFLLLWGGCRHAGKLGSWCVCLSWTWFKIDVHFATLSGPIC